jgi:hypothetical protein
LLGLHLGGVRRPRRIPSRLPGRPVRLRYASYGEAGDLVFFDEAGYGISHVGIATGYGTVIHASTYYGAVVETPIEYIPGYVGAVDAY